MKTITIRPYWAWAIAYGLKRIENRSWQTSHRGSLAIHAGMGNALFDSEAIEEISEIDPKSLGTPEQINSIRGKIIAVCELVDIREYVTCQNDPWASGPFCWLLENVQLLDNPISAKGRLSLWDTDIEI